MGHVRFTWVIFVLFIGLIFFHALAAYSIAGVPLQWMAQLGVVAVCFYVFVKDRIYLFPGFNPLILLLTWAVFVTLGNNIFTDYSILLGSKSTTGYEFFIFLRFLGLIFFLSAILLTYYLCYCGYYKKLIDMIVAVATVVSVLSIYMYLAQILGLPEPPRTRMGTGGGQAVTTFTYAFHRAIGTFREPSHLAEWLVVPFLLSYLRSYKLVNFQGLIIGGVLLLTGSLTGIVSVIGGLIASMMINMNFNTNQIKAFGKILLPVMGAFAIFSLVTVSNNKGVDKGIIDVVWDRIEPIIYDKGVHSTNRSYVYNYFEKQNAPIIGDGLGNANIKFSKYMGIEATVSFLNLFLYMSFSLGIIGFLLTVAFVAYPIILFVLLRSSLKGVGPIFLLSAYVAWLFIFVMHSEEFSLFFGVIYAMLVYHLKFEVQNEHVDQLT